jgi:polyisoprenoid-binding protein YceI
MFIGPKKFVFLLVMTLLVGLGIEFSQAKEVMPLGPRNTKIEGSIPYTVIGKYEARFNDFRGWIALEDNLQKVQSVYLEIQAGSIKSNCPTCDKIARSRRLLNTIRYPKIIFKSDRITLNQNGYKVEGVLEMHGIKKKINFPFKIKIMNDHPDKHRTIEIHGVWLLNRKQFNIIWSRRLDHNGLIVGDLFTVNWEIKLDTSA